jgi:hypothetical protein
MDQARSRVDTLHNDRHQLGIRDEAHGRFAVAGAGSQEGRGRLLTVTSCDLKLPS